MKQIIFFTLALLATSALRAQTLSGQLLDEANRPVSFANVVLLSLPDSTFVSGTITNDDGHFSISGDGRLLRISSVGYTTVYRECSTPSVGTIVMTGDTQLLGEVVVKGDLPVTRMRGDALVTNIENSVLAKAGSANDVLGKMPGIRKTQDAFEVFGKGQPLIYINGRQVRDRSELEQLNSDEIKHVEVITNPGARYDASVKAVIRIQTIRRQGDGFGFDLRSSYYQSENVDLTEQVNLNYRHNSLDLFGSFGYVKNERAQKAEITHSLAADTLWQHRSRLDTHTSSQTVKGEVGANYLIGEKHSLGFRYSLTARPDSKRNSFTRNDITADNRFYDYLENNEQAATSYRPEHQAAAYYNGYLGDLNIDFNADYFANTSTQTALNVEASQENNDRHVHSQTYTKNRLLAGKLILSYPLWGGNLSVGGEYTHTSRNDDYTNEENYVASSFSKVKEGSVNGFAEYSRSFGIGDFSVGARYEYVSFDYFMDNVRVDGQSRSYANWYPHVSFSTRIGPVQTQWSYTAKTRRPSYRQLSNNIIYLDRFTLQQGNPLLEPCTIHDASFTGTWRFLQLLVSYQQQRNAIMYWGEPMADRSSVTLMTYVNYHNLPSLTFLLSASPKVGLWSPNLSVGMLKQWMTVENNGVDMKLNKPVWMVQLNNTFDLPCGFMAGISLDFYGKGHRQNTYATRNYCNVDVSLRKSLLKDALSLELRGSDIFHQARDYSRSFYNQVTWEQDNRYDSRMFSATLRYKFNAAKSKYKGTGAGKEELKRL